MSITRHHSEWLSLVPISGPFLSLPVLAQAFPQGPDAHDADHARRLRMAFEEWDENQTGKRPEPAIHRAWVKFVLGETLGFDELLGEGQAIPQTLRSEVAECGETLRPDWIVSDPATKKARLLVQVYDRSQSLTKPVPLSRWKASPDTRMMQLLHDTGIRLGVVTNGDHWMLVNAPTNETTGYVSWYTNLWTEEPVTLRAFRTLLGADRFFSVPENATLEALLDKSADDQQEVTDQLGYQVRKAVEVLVQSLDKADQDHGRKLLSDVDEKVLYESALTVMMRLVFLFCAEERELLLLGDDLYDRNYAVSMLREQLRVTADQFGEEILGLRYDAWPRLLTTFRAVYGGAKHHRLKLPAYGGSLFNPDRFPFLEGRKSGTSWKTAEAAPLPINNRTVLHLLEALQVLQVRLPGGGVAEARKLSFRALDIERIGHVYEGLLDHTAKRAAEPVLGLQGTRDKEPEIALAELEKVAAKGEKELLEFLKKETGRSESALKKGLNAELSDSVVSRFRTACQDSELWQRVRPFAGLVRSDTVEYPVVITPGSVYVTGGTDRRSSGTHYTPKSLTEPIVQYTLEPLVYVGPAEGLPKEQWKLRSARELLDLKICDMACGSGAFLVQACRYMAARLLEAWDISERAAQTGSQQNFLRPVLNGLRTLLRITPYGLPSQGNLLEQFVPLDPDERQTFALRIVAQRCLYGVDKNPLAAEMAKLSLWLLTLAKDKPFEFLDHAIRCGDSLVGIHNLDQLRRFNLDGKGEDNRLFLHFLDKRIEEAITLRGQITKMQANTVDDVEAQERLLQEANEKIDRLKCSADMLIAAEFGSGSAVEKRVARDNAAIQVAAHFNASDLRTFRREAQHTLSGRPTFHWPLEFPEVIVDRAGFDAFIGNPPFMGGRNITGHFGNSYRVFLGDIVASGTKGGKADLCAFFLRRADQVIHEMSCVGMLTTNTISQGDTRELGLDRLLSNKCVLQRAVASRKWPGTAVIEIAQIWMFRGNWRGEFILDDRCVVGITSHLSELTTGGSTPNRLASNEAVAFKGSMVQGMGFLVPPSEAQQLLQDFPLSKAVLFPCLTGATFNSTYDQSPERWIINFFDWPLNKGSAPSDYSGYVAADFPECLSIVDQWVRPERERLGQKDDPSAKGYAKHWWQYGRRAVDLYKTIRGMRQVLFHSFTSKYLCFAFVPSQCVFMSPHVVVAFDDFGHFAALQSAMHNTWLWEYCSTMRTDIRYAPSDVFETFAFPNNIEALESIGSKYHEGRRSLMYERKEGLTATYNRFHNFSEKSLDIEELRQLHVEMDNAVAAAYGWANLDLGHGFHETKQGIRYTISEPARRKVLARLLGLNRERYAEEVKQGLHDKKKPKGAKGKKVSKATAQAEPSLFGEEDDA